MPVVPPKGISREESLLISVPFPDAFNLAVWQVVQMARDQTPSKKQVVPNP